MLNWQKHIDLKHRYNFSLLIYNYLWLKPIHLNRCYLVITDITIAQYLFNLVLFMHRSQSVLFRESRYNYLQYQINSVYSSHA